MLTNEINISIGDLLVIARIYHEIYKVSSLKDRNAVFGVSVLDPIFPNMIDDYESYCNFLSYCEKVFHIERPALFDEIIRADYKKSKRPSVRWMASRTARIDSEYRKDITVCQLAKIVNSRVWGMGDLIMIDQKNYIF